MRRWKACRLRQSVGLSDWRGKILGIFRLWDLRIVGSGCRQRLQGSLRWERVASRAGLLFPKLLAHSCVAGVQRPYGKKTFQLRVSACVRRFLRFSVLVLLVRWYLKYEPIPTRPSCHFTPNYCYYFLQDNPNIFNSTIIFCCVNWKDVTLFCTLDWLLCLSCTSRSSQEWHSGKISVHKTFLGFGFWVLWVLEKCARQKCNVYHFYKDIAVRVKSCYEDHAHFDRDSFQKFFLSTLWVVHYFIQGHTIQSSWNAAWLVS